MASQGYLHKQMRSVRRGLPAQIGAVRLITQAKQGPTKGSEDEPFFFDSVGHDLAPQ